MSYTVSQAYNRVLEEADKLGSDYFSLSQVLSAFKKETYDFIGERTKEAELNQEVTDDMRSLVKPIKLTLVSNPDEDKCFMAMVPNDYHTKLSLNVLYTDGLTSRKPTIDKMGEDNINNLSPLKKPDRMYPLIQQFSNYFNVNPNLPIGSTIQPDKLILIYFKQPSFGVNNNDVVVDLPNQVCELLFAKTATALLLNIGDERATTTYQVNKLFRE